ncbi:ribosome biogenesis GTP-binding protein YihA/YsxC [soil metagenome]
MKITSATFVKSSAKPDQFPPDNIPEFAFIGRSNVGKSSLINMLVQKKELAKTSGNPGKTQTINHFLINKEWHLVDLPGYGFARVSQDKRAEWKSFMKTYLTKREHLLNVFVLVDLRIEPQKSDLDFINWLGECGVALSVVFTKSDKITRNQVASNVATFKKALLEYWEELPPLFITSAETRLGKEELLAYIGNCLPLYVPPGN